MTKHNSDLEHLIDTACRQYDAEYAPDPIEAADLPETLIRGDRRYLFKIDSGLGFRDRSEVKSITQAVTIGTCRMYAHFLEYPNGELGGIMIVLSKIGDSLRVYNELATTSQQALEYGMPVETLVKSWEYVEMEPWGITSDPKVPTCSSICDYIAKWIKKRYLIID